MLNKQTRLCLATIILIITTCQATAADVTTSTLPPSAEAGRAGQPFALPLMQTPSTMGPIKPPAAKETALSKEAQAIRFTLKGIILKGNTIYTQADLYYLFKCSLNKEISIGELEAITNAITTKYRNAGYILSKAILPPQKISNGVVVIQIIEGFIDKATVEGGARVSRPLVNAYAQKVVCPRPFNIKTLERYVLLANDLSGSDVKAVLEPSKTTPGAASLVLVANEKHYDFYIDKNNRGTVLLGPNQYTVDGALNEIIFPGDRTEVRVAGTFPFRELHYYEVAQTQLLGTEGTQLVLDANYTRSLPSAFLLTTNVDGISYTFSGNILYPAIRSRSQNLYLDATFKYLRSTTNILTDILLFDDRIYDLIFGGSYDRTDSFAGVNQISGHITQSLPILNANKNGEPPPSRPSASNEFTKFNAELSRLQALPKNFSALLMARGQYTFSSLYSSEQFGVGSLPIGAAYDPSEIVGDQGVAARGELRFTVPGNKVLNKATITAMQLYYYYDGGIIWNMHSSGQPDRQSLVSMGAGMRTHLLKIIDAYVEWGQPLTRPVGNLEADNKNGKAARVFFGITARI